MKNRMKKSLALLLAVVMMLCAVPLCDFIGGGLSDMKAHAASYPYCSASNLNITASVGEKVMLVYSYMPAFNYEKLKMKIYDEYGDVVATSERQMNNYSSSWLNSYTVSWDTKDYDPGKYKVVMSYEFYSYYQWNKAPSDSTRYVTLTNNINNGAKDRNKYTGGQESFKDLSDKSATVGSNTVCTAVSAWQDNSIKSAGYSIRLTEMYIGDTADKEAKNENSYNFESDDDDQWVIMCFRISNNNGSALDAYDILNMECFYKYTGTKTTIFDDVSFSNEKTDIYGKDYEGEKIESGETKDIWVGYRIPYSSGMPYLRVKNGNGYTFLNTNPDLISGKKKSGHSFGAWKTNGGFKIRTCTVCSATEKQKNVKQISKCSIGNVSAKAYTGKAITPSVIVKDGNKKLKAGKDYTVTYKNNTAIGKATIIIKGIESSGYTGTKTISFKIIPAAPKATVTAGKKRAAVKWKAVKGAQSYTVYYGTSKNSGFKKAGTTSKTSFNVKNLKSGKTYYFKVVASKKVGKTAYNSLYSSVKKVRIK